ncbi:MAG TPA: sensor histidine kinase [Desulfurella acetivorans]|uniref:histidine kinase n=1 Tax=Desulfurella acetivorans TaxID=33002 RepID=A0A7C6A6G3_DESAE|nr:sensor histidine kinase [Desulfurella acetivorans]
MFKKSIRTKIVAYTFSIMLIVSVLFSVISLYNLLTLRSFFINSSKSVFEVQAKHYLEDEVKSYAKIIEANLNIKEKMCDSTVNFLLKTQDPKKFIPNIYTIMSKDLNIKGIAFLDNNFSAQYTYPADVKFDGAIAKIKAHEYKKFSKNSYFVDFYLNKDKNAYFAFLFPFKGDSYVLFEIDPVGIFSILQSAQIKPMGDKYLWMTDAKGVLVFDPEVKEHPLITLKDHVDLTDPENGEKLAHLMTNYVLKGKTGTSYYTFRGVEKYVGYTSVPKTGWALGLTLPINSLLEGVSKLNQQINSKTILMLGIFSFFSVITILIALFFSMWASNRIVRPILDATNTINAIIMGDVSKRIAYESNDELGELVKSVNNLMDALAQTLANLGDIAVNKENENEQL